MKGHDPENLLDPSELQDADNAILRLGLDPEDFLFELRIPKARKREFYTQANTLEITRLSNGSRVHFDAGSGRKWSVDFTDALKKGVFGSPN